MDCETLLSIACEDTTADFDQFTLATSFLGNEHADFHSNYSVAREFLLRLWGKPPLGMHRVRYTSVQRLSYLKRCQAGGIVLERLARLFVRTVGLKSGFEKLLTDTRDIAIRTWALQPHAYILQWVRGHFV